MLPGRMDDDVEQTFSCTLWVDDTPYLTVGVFALDRDEAAWSGAVEISKYASAAAFARIDEIKAQHKARNLRRRVEKALDENGSS